MNSNNEIKHLNVQPIHSTKIEPVKLKAGDEQNLSKIGVCLIEKLKNIQCHQQPNEISTNLFYNQEKGYARLKVGEINKQELQDEQEKLIFKDITLQHANICPHFRASKLEEYQVKLSQLTATTGVAVCGIIIDNDNHVLITKRHPQMRTYPCCWVFPGGQVDVGESLIQTVFREIKEEVGLNIIYKEQKQELVIDKQTDQYQQNSTKDIIHNNQMNQLNQVDQKETIQNVNNVEINKSIVHLAEEPKALFLYESVFPTDLKINYPQRSSLVLFYVIKIQESYKNIQLQQSKDEIEYSAWINLDLIYKLIEEDSIKDQDFLNLQIQTGLNFDHSYFPIAHNYLVGIYPNQHGEGIGEAHIKALRFLKRVELEKKQNNLS